MNFLSAFCGQYFWLLLYVIHSWHKLPCGILRGSWSTHPPQRLVQVLPGAPATQRVAEVWPPSLAEDGLHGEDLNPQGLPGTVLATNPCFLIFECSSETTSPFAEWFRRVCGIQRCSNRIPVRVLFITSVVSSRLLSSVSCWFSGDKGNKGRKALAGVIKQEYD